jgi:predicted dehydrogenase
MAPDLHAGILGTGWVAREHAKAYQRNPRVRLHGVCSRSLASAQLFAQEYAIPVVYPFLEAMLADDALDAISICTPNAAHYGHALAVAHAGKHLLVEKPLCTSGEQARQILAAVRAARVQLAVGHVARFVPLFQAARDLVERGFLGRLYYAECDYQHYVEPHLALWQWARHTRHGGGMFLAGGTHSIDLLVWLMGPVAEVCGLKGRFVRDDITAVDDVATPERDEDSGVALLRFASGGMGRALTLVGSKRPYHFHLGLFGTEGTIDDRLLYSDHIPGLTAGAEIRHTLTLPTAGLEHWEAEYHPFNELIDNFVAAIVDGAAPICPPEEAAHVIEVIDAFYRSVREQRWIAVPTA